MPRPLSPSSSASSIARRARRPGSRPADRPQRRARTIRPFRRPVAAAALDVRGGGDPRGRRSPSPRARGPPTSAAGGTRGIVTHRSIRSRSGPDTRAGVALRRRPAGSGIGPSRRRPSPQGHGFIAATNWKRAGNVVARPTRAIDTRPSSSGWRSASRTSRANSGSSSRNRTPWSARVTSPGDMRGPPPTMAAYESVWCGARTGGRRTSSATARRPRPRRRSSPPAPPRRRAAAAGPGSSGRAASCPIPAARRAAARGRRRARSRAPRRASSWPRTSARSATSSGIAHRRIGAGDGRRRRAARRRPRPRPRSTRGGSAPVRRPDAAPDRLDGLAQRRDADRLDPGGEPRLVAHASSGDDDPPEPPPRERGGHRQDPGHRAHLAAERQLADQRDPTRRGADLLRPEQDPHRDREVERRAGLALLGRREVDRDPARRMDEPGVPDRAADPLARLLERRVGEADDREPGQPAGDVDLDPDDPAVEADERGGQEGREHAPDR